MAGGDLGWEDGVNSGELRGVSLEGSSRWECRGAESGLKRTERRQKSPVSMPERVSAMGFWQLWHSPSIIVPRNPQCTAAVKKKKKRKKKKQTLGPSCCCCLGHNQETLFQFFKQGLIMNYGFVFIISFLICEHFLVHHDVICVLFLCSLGLFECLCVFQVLVCVLFRTTKRELLIMGKKQNSCTLLYIRKQLKKKKLNFFFSSLACKWKSVNYFLM